MTDRSFDVAGPWKLSAPVRLIEDFGHFRKLLKAHCSIEAARLNAELSGFAFTPTRRLQVVLQVVLYRVVLPT